MSVAHAAERKSSGLGADSKSILQAVRMGALVRDAALMMTWQEFDPEVEHLFGIEESDSMAVFELAQ